MSNICKKCTKSITDKQPGIECGFCLKFFHGRCLSLSKDQIAIFTDIQGSVYKCEDCRSDVNVVEAAATNTLIQALNDLKNVVKMLQDEVKYLREKKDSEVIDAVIQELTERKNREKNIIIYRLEESTGRNKVEADLKHVKDILSAIAPDMDVSSIKVQRLGKSTRNTAAPVKVMLSSKEDVFTILSVKKNLKGSDWNIQISPDRTQRQREKLNIVLDEMNKRKRNGEVGLFIKYIRGEPVIATKN